MGVSVAVGVNSYVLVGVGVSVAVGELVAVGVSVAVGEAVAVFLIFFGVAVAVADSCGRHNSKVLQETKGNLTVLNNFE